MLSKFRIASGDRDIDRTGDYISRKYNFIIEHVPSHTHNSPTNAYVEVTRKCEKFSPKKDERTDTHTNQIRCTIKGTQREPLRHMLHLLGPSNNASPSFSFGRFRLLHRTSVHSTACNSILENIQNENNKQSIVN